MPPVARTRMPDIFSTVSRGSPVPTRLYCGIGDVISRRAFHCAISSATAGWA